MVRLHSVLLGPPCITHFWRPHFLLSLSHHPLSVRPALARIPKRLATDHKTCSVGLLTSPVAEVRVALLLPPKPLALSPCGARGGRISLGESNADAQSAASGEVILPRGSLIGPSENYPTVEV